MPGPDVERTPDASDVFAAARRLEDIVASTPVLEGRALDARVGAKVLLKCENFQRTGSFKFRGAYNAISQLTSTDRRNGVLSASSGNHAQALALACSMLGVDARIVMPQDAPRLKLAATRGYGATVVEYDRAETTRERLVDQIHRETSRTVIPSYDHPLVIAGQGTTAVELFQQVEKLDVLIVCLGGGGLLSGCALAARNLQPKCRVLGVEPNTADDAARTLRTGVLHAVHNPQTIADGAKAPSLGVHTRAIVTRDVDDIVTVSDDEIKEAMRWLFERQKIVVEPTGALAMAGLLSGRISVDSGDRVGVILSGGNVDPERFSQLFSEA